MTATDKEVVTQPKSQTHDRPGGPLISEFASDPDMRELVEFFVDELKSRVASLQSAFDDGNAGEVRMLAHQLKGAGGGYGFPSITTCAGELEQAIDAGVTEFSKLREQLDALIELCQRASV